jgi:hypothetical protein
LLIGSCRAAENNRRSTEASMTELNGTTFLSGANAEFIAEL